MIDEIAKCYYILLIILIPHLEKRLTILNHGELRHHRARPENIAVLHDIMPVDLQEDPPIFLTTRLASRDAPSPSSALPTSPPDCPRSGDTWFCWGVQRTPLWPQLAPPGPKNDAKLCWIFWNPCNYPRGRDPGSTPGPPQDTHTQLIAEGRFPCILVGPKCAPFCCCPLLGDTEVSPIDCHETVVEEIPLFLTVGVILHLRGCTRPSGQPQGYTRG